MRSLRSVLVFFWMAVTVIPFASVIIISLRLSDRMRAGGISPDLGFRGAVEAVRLVGGIQYTVTR